MNIMKKSLFGKAVSVSVLAMFVIAMNGSMVYAASAIKVKHESLAYFVPEKRIMVQAEVTQGAAEVRLMRCYFRSTEQADYVFVGMTSEKDGVYNGILPAPSKDSKTIQYLFLVVDQKNQPIKTQVFMMNKQDDKDAPEWQQVSSDGDIQVSTELADAPKSVPGFSDSITTDVVESSARFGVAAGGIYPTASTGAAIVTGTGLSKEAWIGIGAGAAALIGGIAALGGGGGGGDETPATISTSTWEFHSKCATSSVETPVIFNVQLNETNGGAVSGSGTGQRADYEGGIPITISMSGNYDAKTRVISGAIDSAITKFPFSCVRHDNFSVSLSSNDTGYQNAVEQGSGDCGSEPGCMIQIRFVKK